MRSFFFRMFLMWLPVFLNAADLNLRVSNSRECEFDVYFNQLAWDTLEVEGVLYEHLDFPQASYSAKPGEPGLPEKAVIVAIPPGASVQVSVSAPSYIEFDKIRLLPSPGLIKGEFSEERFIEGPAYQTSEYQPMSLFRVSDPSWIGDINAVHIALTPVQYNPALGKARLYKQLTVRIQFTGGNTVPARSAGIRPSSSIRHLFINSDMAAAWNVRSGAVRKNQRVFSGGPWYKIPVSDENIYRLTGKALKDRGIDVQGMDLSTLKLYNNGGRMLPRNISDPRPEGLIEIPVIIDDGGDGILNDQDAVYFYGKGLEGWDYDTSAERFAHYIHLYDTRNIYWMTFNDQIPGKRIELRRMDAGSAVPVDRTADGYFYEKEKTNPINAGIQWYAEKFSVSMGELNYTLSLNNPVSPDTLLVAVQVKGGEAGSTHKFDFRLNGQMLPSLSFSGSIVRYKTMTLPVSTLGSDSRFGIQYQGNGSAYLDWFEIIYNRPLTAASDQLMYFSPAKSGVYNFQLSGFSSEPIVWDVTRPGESYALEVTQSGNVWSCVDTVQTGKPKRYAAFRLQSAVSVSEIYQDDFVSDLRNSENRSDMIILTPRVFYAQAERLKAMRETEDTLQVMVVDIQDVYDEFSGGLTDPTAIRDFMAAAWSWKTRPGYLLLFGDATFAYKESQGAAFKNYIPTFEKDTFNEETASAVDEWFGRVSGNDSDVDIAIGRLPVQTEDEAKIVVDKIIAYETDKQYDIWRTTVTLVADDVQKGTAVNLPSEMTHINATEALAKYTVPESFNLRKIYLTEYKLVIQADGRRKPGAKDDLFEQVNMGTLLVNYTGHGHESVWAHEQVLLQPGDLGRFENGDRLPLVYGATCTFARFDFTDKQSMAENLLLLEGGGSIASIGASRECFAPPNEALNRSFLRFIFADQSRIRIGEALRLAKIIESGSKDNNEKYTLLGDPALRLAIPDHRINVDSLNPDSLKALSVTKVIAHTDSVIQNFQGQAVVSVFDSQKPRKFGFYDSSERNYFLNYTLPGNTLFRGQASVNQGELNASFIVPKDISYGQNQGRISLYAYNAQTDAFGVRKAIPVGGSSTIKDNEGPDIFVAFTENPNFITGGMIFSDPELLAEIGDEKTGINITGEIGHKLMLTVDGIERDVSAFFHYNQDDYLKGTLRYKLTGLAEGQHSLSLKAWDNANNSSNALLVFQIVPRGRLILQEVLNYPNPFSSSTHFTFQVSHASEITIKIYTVDGRLIRRISEIWADPGFNMISWDGRDEFGDMLSNGVYIYKIEVLADVDGKQVSTSEMNKAMIYR